MTLAVIIPVLNSSKLLAETLRAVSSGRRLPDELIVVDDGSTDASAEIAEQFGASVIVMPTNVGPAACRNEAALLAQSDILVFLDADTCPHEDTLERMGIWLEDASVTAVIGSYDDTPRDPRLCSQYRNLAHCYVHRTSKPKALTFWTGCGAIRREAFLSARGFDERFRKPSIEDIELGYRISDGGARIVLDPKICVTHLKRWTVWNSIVTDIADRGTPWMLLLLERGKVPDDLNTTRHHRLASLLTVVSLACLVASCWSLGWLVPAVLLTFVCLAMEAGLLRFLYQKGGSRLCLVGAAMILLQNFCKVSAAVIALAIFSAGLLPWRPHRKGEPTFRIYSQHIEEIERVPDQNDMILAESLQRTND